MKYMKDAARFLERIDKKDGTIIVFNNDGDGICSCALVMLLLEKRGMKKPYIISQPMPMDKNLVQRIKTTVPDKIIFLDLVVDQQEDILKKVRGLADILIVDHHKINKNLNKGWQTDAKIVVVNFNPRFTKSGIYQSTSYCAYKICSEIEDMSDYLWLAGVGIVSDYNIEDSKDVLNEVKKKYSIESEPYNSFLGRISNMIAAARATKLLSCEQIVELLLKAEDPEKIGDAHGGNKLVESLGIIDTEISDVMEDAKRNAIIDGNLVSYNIKSKYNIDSVVSTKLSENYRNKLVIVWNNRDTRRYKVSARNQDKNIDAGKIMKKACEGLKASGGGHEAAAGATVDEKDWEKFLENVKELINDML